jgi:uncharacterized membrane protein
MTDDSRPEAAPPPPPPPPPVTPPPAGGESSNRSVMLVLSYLWILALIPLLMEQDDQDVRWHAKHGLILLGAEIAAFLAIGILSGLSGGLGCLLVPLAQLGVLVFHIVCIAKALKGERLLIPGLSDFASKF